MSDGSSSLSVMSSSTSSEFRSSSLSSMLASRSTPDSSFSSPFIDGEWSPDCPLSEPSESSSACAYPGSSIHNPAHQPKYLHHSFLLIAWHGVPRGYTTKIHDSGHIGSE